MITSVWWCNIHLEKYEFVNWDDDIPNVWKHKKCLKPATRHDKNKLGIMQSPHFELWYVCIKIFMR